MALPPMLKNAIDIKGLFFVKTRRFQYINDLENKKSRRWVK